MAKVDALRRAAERMREVALSYPEVHEDFPWGESAFKVKGKVFLFMWAGKEQLSLSTKLPQSNAAALMLPFATPTGYGLGKSGWVSAAFSPGEEPPVELLRAWVDESYRAVAPKKLVASLSAPGAGAAEPAASTPKPAKAKTAKTAKAKTAAKQGAGRSTRSPAKKQATGRTRK